MTTGHRLLLLALAIVPACRSSALPAGAKSDPVVPPAAISASLPPPDPCAGLGAGDDAALVVALERCTRLSFANAPHRAILAGSDGAVVWLTVRGEDGGAPPDSFVVDRRVLVAWLDTKHARVAAWSVADQPSSEMATFRARAETLAGEKVLVDTLEALLMPRPGGCAPCAWTAERVWLVRGTTLKDAGRYPLKYTESRGPQLTDPERTSTSVPRFHDDRIDLHDDVTWNWYERKYTDMFGPERRAVRRSTSTYDRVFVLEGDALHDQPGPIDSAPSPHPVSDGWH